MKAKEIKNAVDQGLTVYYKDFTYTVVKSNNDYFIKASTGRMIGLTWEDGTTLNGKESDFFVK